MSENRYTPATLGDKVFSIPLYQRLFEWSTTEIEQLLDDLYNSYQKAQGADKPYYIGMLTGYCSRDSKRIDLVDGQQRFTVMMLISIALGWNDFYKVGNELRLTFFAREIDQAYIEFRCGLRANEPADGFNQKMKTGIEFVEEYFKNKKKVKPGEQTVFSNYIKNNMTFFMSILPEHYDLPDLNKYFESMNSAGRALENYEILKVELLKTLDSDKERYTRLWNVVSDMDVQLVRLEKGAENEKRTVFRKRYMDAIQTAERNPLEFFNKDQKKRLLNN